MREEGANPLPDAGSAGDDEDTTTGKRYCSLRNEVTRLVMRDKQDSKLLSLKTAKNDPKVLWGLADQALGKDCPRPFQRQSTARTGTPRQPTWRQPRQ
jgi:hypothetical protein